MLKLSVFSLVSKKNLRTTSVHLLAIREQDTFTHNSRNRLFIMDYVSDPYSPGATAILSELSRLWKPVSDQLRKDARMRPTFKTCDSVQLHHFIHTLIGGQASPRQVDDDVLHVICYSLIHWTFRTFIPELQDAVDTITRDCEDQEAPAKFLVTWQQLFDRVHNIASILRVGFLSLERNTNWTVFESAEAAWRAHTRAIFTPTIYNILRNSFPDHVKLHHRAQQHLHGVCSAVSAPCVSTMTTQS